MPEPATHSWTLFTVTRAALRLLWIFLDNVVEISVYATLMMLCIVCRWIWPSMYWEFDSWLFREILRTIGYWIWTAGINIVEYGDSPFTYHDDRCLMIINHQSTGDVPIICASIAKKGTGGGKVMWVLDSMFKWTNFGLVTAIRGDYFITQGKEIRQAQLGALSSHMRQLYWTRDRRWFIIFPEGGFLHKRRATSQRYGLNNGFPILNHCTLPRIAGVKVILDTANPVRQVAPPIDENQAQQSNDRAPPAPLIPPPGPGFRYLVDVTIAYPNPDDPLGMDNIMFGNRPPCEVSVHYRRIPIEDVPHQNEEALRDYLYSLWVEKERLLNHYNKHRHFPGYPRRDGVLVDYHTAGMIFHHGLFVVLFLVLSYWVYIPVFEFARGYFHRSAEDE